MLQLPLDFELKVDATFDNFIEGDNALLVRELNKISLGEPEFLYFYGAAGTGKSHLLQALAHTTADQDAFNLAYLPLNSEMVVPQMLAGFDSFDCVCLDDFQTILEKPDAAAWQESLFHLYNKLKEQNKSLVIAANEAPTGLPLQLQDLKSRLSAMFIHEIKSLSEQDKLLFIKRKSNEKGLALSDDLANFILARSKRDLESINASLEKLDAASLQAKRKITKPFIKEVLNF
ncbi:MAG: DnaA regulatory inactivator Hda [Gammaproteobacteria bacterium]|nr:DnaA regulatory inactivator Hda [Gammaproteobacteria bacterium]